MVELEGREQIVDPVTQLLRNGARRLIEQAVEAELEQLLAAHAVRRTDDNKAGVVRNGYLPERPLQTILGPVTVTVRNPRCEPRAQSQSLSAQHWCHPTCARPERWKLHCPGCT